MVLKFYYFLLRPYFQGRSFKNSLKFPRIILGKFYRNISWGKDFHQCCQCKIKAQGFQNSASPITIIPVRLRFSRASVGNLFRNFFGKYSKKNLQKFFHIFSEIFPMNHFQNSFKSFSRKSFKNCLKDISGNSFRYSVRDYSVNSSRDTIKYCFKNVSLVVLPDFFFSKNFFQVLPQVSSGVFPGISSNKCVRASFLNNYPFFVRFLEESLKESMETILMESQKPF